MFIIWGFGRTTTKRYGFAQPSGCERCGNAVQMELLKITTWFTLFFIPIIPYSTKHCLVCPICREAKYLTKDEFMQLVSTADSSDTNSPQSDSIKYAGKTPTQIAYLKQMEEAEREKAMNR